MTATDFATILLTDFSPEERAIPDAALYPGRNAWVKSAINGAIQEYWLKTGASVREEEVGDLIHAPTAVTITVTAASSESGIATGYAEWMAGCSIVIVGHDIDNQIRTAETDGTETILKYPYGGSSGTVAALVYHDSMMVRDDVMQVLKPVRVDRQEIWPVANPGNFGLQSYGDFGRSQNTYRAPLNSRVADTTGTICGYKVETYSPAETGEAEAMADLRARWPKAEFVEAPDRLQDWVRDAFGQGAAGQSAPLYLIGAPFQIKVWEALLRIPSGQVTTYSEIATAVGHPKAVRAVGTAVGRNPVSWLIPCHRALRKSGGLGGYHWGLPVKRAMLAWEAARSDAA